jgi:AcrR family transcriptional regulator
MLAPMPRRSLAYVSETRTAILEVAVHEASIKGLEGLTIGTLASEMEMSKSTLLGYFGSKEQLQLDTFEEACFIFLREVWKPAMRERPGRARLRALIDAWLSYLEREVFPGGCLMTTASVEFDNLHGPVRDAVAKANRDWLGMLEREFSAAGTAGDLPTGLDPADAAFELNALAIGANCTFQLHREQAAIERARRAMLRLVGDG